MKFSKYAKKRKAKVSRHSPEYVREQQEQMWQLVAAAKTDAERDAIIKAYHVSMNP